MRKLFLTYLLVLCTYARGQDVFIMPFYGGAAAWTPAAIDSLKFWVESSTLSLTDGDSVATWTDGSGKGYDLTAPTGRRPTFKTNIGNGQPAVRFAEGAQEYMIADSLVKEVRGDDVPWSVVVCARLKNWPTTGTYLEKTILVFNDVASDDRIGYLFYTDTDPGKDIRMLRYKTSGLYGSVTATADTAAIRDQGTVIIAVDEGDSTTVQYDATAGTRALTNFAAIYPTNFQVGAYKDWGVVKWWASMDLFGVCVYRKRLTTSEIATLRTYFKDKYGTR